MMSDDDKMWWTEVTQCGQWLQSIMSLDSLQLGTGEVYVDKPGYF